VARNNIYPSTGSPFDAVKTLAPNAVEGSPRDFGLNDFSNSVEGGGRIDYVFENGLDLSFLFYNHYNRNEVYAVSGFLGQTPILSPVVQRTQSYGLTASYAINDWVLRADSVLTLNQPIQANNFTSVGANNDWQTIVGADMSSEGWTLGVQFQSDIRVDWSTSGTANLVQGEQLYWASAKVSKKLFNDKMLAEVLGFAGLNNKDVWVEPKLTWFVNSSLTASVQFDIFNNFGLGNLDGIIAPFNGNSRGLLLVSYKL
jgi:hypothetical protein